MNKRDIAALAILVLSVAVFTIVGVEALFNRSTTAPILTDLPSVSEANALFEPLNPTEALEMDVVIAKDGSTAPFDKLFAALPLADLKKEIEKAEAVVKTVSCGVYKDAIPNDERTLTVELTKCTFEDTTLKEAIDRLAPQAPGPKA